MAPIIEILAVHKTYGAFKALNGIDLSVEEGEVVVVIGPSGSGKSTLIRCINQLEVHDSGTIRVHGLEAGQPDALTRLRTEAGMVFQSFNLFPHMRVLRNVALAPVRVRGLSWAEANERARKLLNRVGLAEQMDKFPNQLSGGQQQRVGIARALAM
jgi:polar amino acid transport system ATP-binding protein/general L-amino acid transport system ATP-binding protein